MLGFNFRKLFRKKCHKWAKKIAKMNEKRLIYIGSIILLLICVISSINAGNEPSNDDQNSHEIQRTMDFLTRGERKLKLDPKYRNFTIMIGTTGTGKSTLVQFITDKLSNLESFDKGGYIIKHRFKDVIGSTTQSFTIFPELVLDEVQTAFYDCPGFEDTRNVSIDIAASYFMKKVVDYADSLKIVLVMDYASMVVGSSRSNFPNLMRHVTAFVRNVTNYKGSIALVATKVDLQMEKVKGAYVPVSDAKLIQRMIVFYDEYRNTMLNQPQTAFSQQVLNLLDILTTTRDNGTTYDKLALFRRPDEAGTLDKIELMVDGRKNIREMLNERLVYSKRIDSDFGYTISSDSKGNLTLLAAGINAIIANTVRNVSKEIEAHLNSETIHLGNLGNLTNRFQQAYVEITKIVNEAEHLTPSGLSARLHAVCKSLRIPISSEHLDNLDNQEEYIKFLQNFTADALPINPTGWVVGLKNCTQYLEENKDWYKFLYDIYEAYSQYEFRRSISDYNVSNIDDWGTSGKPQGIYIDRVNFWKFVQKQKTPAIKQNQKPNEFQLNTLNSLLRITIIQRPTVTCANDGTTMVVKGDYISLSEVDLTACGEQCHTLHIFALHTVYVDSDLSTGGKAMNISILATRWYIWGDRRITVDGADAGNVATEMAKNGTKNEAAAAGLPGLAGGRAGNFLGLGLNFVNGDRLKVHGKWLGS